MHMQRLKSGFLLIGVAGWVAAGLGIALGHAVTWQLGILVAIAGVALSLAIIEGEARRVPPRADSRMKVRASQARANPLPRWVDGDSEQSMVAYATAEPRAPPAQPSRPRLSSLPAAPSADNPIHLGRRPARASGREADPATMAFDDVDTIPFGVVARDPKPLAVTIANGPRMPNGAGTNGASGAVAKQSVSWDKDSMPLTSAILGGSDDSGTAFTEERVTRGVCSKCDTPIVLSSRRPIRATCPVCGHSKLLN